LAAKPGSDALNLRIETAGFLKSDGKRSKSAAKFGIGRLKLSIVAVGCAAVPNISHGLLDLSLGTLKRSGYLVAAGEKPIDFGRRELSCDFHGATLLSMGSP
jgi:hypothetical protein